MKILIAAKTTFHRPKVTKELKDMEPLFLPLLRRFHVPACSNKSAKDRMPERWNVVTRLFQTKVTRQETRAQWEFKVIRFIKFKDTS